MISIFTGTLLISILHALIPSHWLPITALSHSLKWTKKETLLVTFYLGISHVASTLLLGIVLYFLGKQIEEHYSHYFEIAVPIGLILIGIVFIYRHHTHHHFHIDEKEARNKRTKLQIVSSLMLLMFLSPCLEIEAYFLLAGQFAIWFLIVLVTTYTILTIGGMLLWVSVALKGLKHANWHRIEHNAGLITGVILIITGIFSFFVH
jgi:hypothetical protein